MDPDCPLQLGEWIEAGCRAWAMPWVGVTGFACGTPIGQAIKPQLIQCRVVSGFPRVPATCPVNQQANGPTHCHKHDRAPGVDPRDGTLTCGPGLGGAEQHEHSYGYRFVPSTGNDGGGGGTDSATMSDRKCWDPECVLPGHPDKLTFPIYRISIHIDAEGRRWTWRGGPWRRVYTRADGAAIMSAQYDPLP